MFNSTVYAHEEGISTGQEAWLGPVLFFVIIFLSIIVTKSVTKRSHKNMKGGDKNE